MHVHTRWGIKQSEYHNTVFTLDCKIFWLSLKYWFGWLMPVSHKEPQTASNANVHANCTNSPHFSQLSQVKQKQMHLKASFGVTDNLLPDNAYFTLDPLHLLLLDYLLRLYQLQPISFPHYCIRKPQKNHSTCKIHHPYVYNIGVIVHYRINLKWLEWIGF